MVVYLRYSGTVLFLTLCPKRELKPAEKDQYASIILFCKRLDEKLAERWVERSCESLVEWFGVRLGSSFGE